MNGTLWNEIKKYIITVIRLILSITKTIAEIIDEFVGEQRESINEIN